MVGISVRILLKPESTLIRGSEHWEGRQGRSVEREGDSKILDRFRARDRHAVEQHSIYPRCEQHSVVVGEMPLRRMLYSTGLSLVEQGRDDGRDRSRGLM